uniref:Uncharacterized protein n=1 Tax=Meloidogyne enterolobii TaxID=390850 RepID=A0A6V7U9A5_MELEN|nr:unnamed protein product [Meloidogyne enterolobii]
MPFLRKILIFLIISLIDSAIRRRHFLNCHPSFRCYLFLFSLFYCCLNKDIWHNNGKFSSLKQQKSTFNLNNQKIREHLFIYTSFLLKEREDLFKEKRACKC